MNPSAIRMDLVRRAAGAMPGLARIAAGSIALRAAGALFGLAFNVVLSRSLAPAGAGVVFFYLNLAALLGIIATCGMDVVGLRELARRADDAVETLHAFGTVLANGFVATTVWTAGLLAAFWLVGTFEPARAEWPAVAAASCMLALAAFQKMFSDWLIALKEFAASQLVFYFINRVVTLTFALVAVLVVRGPASERGGIFLWTYAAGLAVAVVYAVIRLAAHFPAAGVIRSLRISGALFLDGLACNLQITAFIALSLSPFVLLAWLSTSAQVGFFGASQRLVALVILALTAVSQFAMRDFARAHHDGDCRALAAAMTTSVRLTAGLAAALSFPLLVLAPVWVMIFGKGFGPAAPVLVLLTAGIFCQCLGMPFQSALFGTNNERAARNVTIVAATVGIGLNALLIPTWGALGAAAGTGVGLALQSAGHTFCILKAVPLRANLLRLRLEPAQPCVGQSGVDRMKEHA